MKIENFEINAALSSYLTCINAKLCVQERSPKKQRLAEALTKIICSTRNRQLRTQPEAGILHQRQRHRVTSTAGRAWREAIQGR